MEFRSYSGDDSACTSDEQLESYSEKLKVCGHPMRLKLLCRIAREQEPCVSDLWTCLDQPQPVVSQHLAVLKSKGIVTSEVRGNRRVYRIVDPFIEQIVSSLVDQPLTVPSSVAPVGQPVHAAAAR